MKRTVHPSARSGRPTGGSLSRRVRAGLLVTALALLSLGVLSSSALADANAVVPTTSAAGTSATEITNYQQVTWVANDDGTWPCGGGGNASPSCPGPDGESGPTVYPFGFNINFYGTEYSGAYINNNGNLTFDGPLPEYTPSLSYFGSPLIAPFFGDVDTRGASSAVVNFGQGTLDGHKVFVVNWPGVGCYNANSSVLDDFQVILIDRSDRNTGPTGDDFDIEFNYNTIQWDTGQASGGDANCENGPSGNSAYVGFSNGTSTDTYVLPGSGTPNSFLDSNASTGLIYNDLNSSTLGRYLFTVVNGQPTQPTSIATSLGGGGQSGASISVPAGTAVIDSSTLSGTNAGTATGSVTYDVYSDANCTQLVSGPDQESIATAGTMPSSQAVTLNSPGTYYWQATYSGDSTNDGSVSQCGAEVETVTATTAQTSIATSLGGGGQSGADISVPAGTAVTDSSVLSGVNAGSATGSVTYDVYSDAGCTQLVSGPDQESIATAGTMPSSQAVTLNSPGTYYWQATYSGDSTNDGSTSACGSEVETVAAVSAAPTSLATWASGGTYVAPGTAVGDQATLSGANVASAGGTVTYSLWSDADCTVPVGLPQTVSVTDGVVPSSTPVVSPQGIYYFTASYSGDALNEPSSEGCRGEVYVVGSSARFGADVGVQIETQPAPPQTVGSDFSVCVTVVNFGPNPAKNIVLGLLLGSGLKVIDPAGATVHGRLLIWKLGTYYEGVWSTFSVQVQATKTGSPRITDGALALGTLDPNYHNNVAAESVTVNGALQSGRRVAGHVIRNVGGGVFLARLRKLGRHSVKTRR